LYLRSGHGCGDEEVIGKWVVQPPGDCDGSVPAMFDVARGASKKVRTRSQVVALVEPHE